MRLLYAPGDVAGLHARSRTDNELSLADLTLLYALPVARGHGRDVLRANMVMSLDGAIASQGRSAGLSGPADKDVFAVLRSLADVVLVGAATARTEGYRPIRLRPELGALRRERGQSSLPRVAVVSRSLDLDPESELMGDPGTIVITTEAADEHARAELAQRVTLVVAGDDRVDFVQALAALRAQGLRHILCEGGPTVLGNLMGLGVVDELCLSLAPQLPGGTQLGLLGGAQPATPALELLHVATADGFLFTRYRVLRDGTLHP